MEKHPEQTPAGIAASFINGTNCNIFLTGKAGTGKTTFLKEIISKTHKKTIVAAPTGIAAINAGGVTLHSLFQLPFGTFIPANIPFNAETIPFPLNTPKTLKSSMQMHKQKRRMIEEMELLIIDEVSMLRADILDAIDNILRSIKKQQGLPFGGTQILFIGDLLQLPPVVKQEERAYLGRFYSSMYFFEAKALENIQPLYIELEKIFRQTDQKFINILNHLRDNKITQEDVEILNSYHKPSFKPSNDEGYVYLTTHNRKVDEINRTELKNLPGRSYFYDAEVKGDYKEYLYPVEYTLELREGAQVMFIKNDYSGEQRYFNGKIGTVSDLSDEHIEVNFNDGTPPVEVEGYTWENKKYTLNKDTNEIDEKLSGSFTHFPIKLAWAVTVHKSQGLTFDKAIIDVSRAFAPGQIYVALSRLVSLNGLVLNEKIPFNRLSPDIEIKNFADNKQTPATLQEVYTSESKKFIKDTVMRAFNMNSLYNLFNYHVKSYDKDEKRSTKQHYKGWAIKIVQDLQPVKEVADKFLVQLHQLTNYQDNEELPKLQERVKAAKDYFEPRLKEFSKRIFDHIGEMQKQVGVKKYITELRDNERLFFSQLQSICKAEALIDAAINNTEISKESINNSFIYDERHKMMDEKKIKRGKDKSNSVKKNHTKKDKVSTKDITYQLYQSGKTIEEIATERSLAFSTIEGHLAHFVSEGVLDVKDFVEQKKIDAIREVARRLDTNMLTPIIKHLGDEYTYGDLRFVMAAEANTEDGKQKAEG